MDIASLPEKAQIWLSIIQFEYIGYHFQSMMFTIASIMSDDSLSYAEQARRLAEYSDMLDSFDKEVVLDYVSKYSKFNDKRWTK